MNFTLQRPATVFFLSCFSQATLFYLITCSVLLKFIPFSFAMLKEFAALVECECRTQNSLRSLRIDAYDSRTNVWCLSVISCRYIVGLCSPARHVRVFVCVSVCVASLTPQVVGNTRVRNMTRSTCALICHLSMRHCDAHLVWPATCR
jgi:hypothetical protein